MSDTSTSAGSARGRGETILVVDDEPFVREITCQVLISAGYSVLQAGRAEEALSTFYTHQGPVDLLLTDMMMPGKTGPELAAQLGALSPEMKTVLTSGHGETVAEEFCRDPRVFFLPKPFSMHALTATVRSVLGADQSCSCTVPCSDAFERHSSL